MGEWPPFLALWVMGFVLQGRSEDAGVEGCPALTTLGKTQGVAGRGGQRLKCNGNEERERETEGVGVEKSVSEL